MALLHSFESQGNFLFRYRGYLPVLLFIPAIPVIYFTSAHNYPPYLTCWLTGISVGFSLLGIIIRAIAIATTPKGTSGRNTDKQVAESLNNKGIYSVVRHPLYLGNFFMWMGIVAFTFNAWFFVSVALAFWIYYERIMFAEERFLERKFGDLYLDWSLKVPAFVPDFTKYMPSAIPFSWKSIFRREYSGWLATISCFTLVDLLRTYYQSYSLSFNRLSVYFFVITLVISLVIRSLKHYTHILHEEDRS